MVTATQSTVLVHNVNVDDGATLLTVVHVVLLLHRVHIRDVVHRHETSEHRHHHLRFHLGYVLR